MDLEQLESQVKEAALSDGYSLEHVEHLFHILRRIYKAVPNLGLPSHIVPAFDEVDTILCVWKSPNYHYDIEVWPNGWVEWFWTLNTPQSIFDGGYSLDLKTETRLLKQIANENESGETRVWVHDEIETVDGSGRTKKTT